MDIRQLRYFVTIVNANNNITKAAKMLNMAQPPLSQQLKALEQQLDVELFKRRGKKLELTEEGKLLYDRAIHLIEALDDVKKEVRDVQRGVRGQLSIGVSGFYSYMLPEKMKAFYERYPYVSFRVVQSDANRLIQLLESSDIELALVNLPVEMVSGQFAMERLDNIAFSLFIPKDWAWEMDEISFRNLADIPLILTRREDGSGGSYDAIMNECHRLQIRPKIIAECNDIQFALSLVHAGLGATILPDYIMNRLQGDNIQLVKIKDAYIFNESVILWRHHRYLSQLAQHFLTLF